MKAPPIEACLVKLGMFWRILSNIRQLAPPDGKQEKFMADFRLGSLLRKTIAFTSHGSALLGIHSWRLH
jgi:hypothetical protein